MIDYQDKNNIIYNNAKQEVDSQTSFDILNNNTLPLPASIYNHNNKAYQNDKKVSNFTKTQEAYDMYMGLSKAAADGSLYQITQDYKDEIIRQEQAITQKNFDDKWFVTRVALGIQSDLAGRDLSRLYYERAELNKEGKDLTEINYAIEKQKDYVASLPTGSSGTIASGVASAAASMWDMKGILATDMALTGAAAAATSVATTGGAATPVSPIIAGAAAAAKGWKYVRPLLTGGASFMHSREVEIGSMLRELEDAGVDPETAMDAAYLYGNASSIVETAGFFAGADIALSGIREAIKKVATKGAKKTIKEWSKKEITKEMLTSMGKNILIGGASESGEELLQGEISEEVKQRIAKEGGVTNDIGTLFDVILDAYPRVLDTTKAIAKNLVLSTPLNEHQQETLNTLKSTFFGSGLWGGSVGGIGTYASIKADVKKDTIQKIKDMQTNTEKTKAFREAIKNSEIEQKSPEAGRLITKNIIEANGLSDKVFITSDALIDLSNAARDNENIAKVIAPFDIQSMIDKSVDGMVEMDVQTFKEVLLSDEADEVFNMIASDVAWTEESLTPRQATESLATEATDNLFGVKTGTVTQLEEKLLASYPEDKRADKNARQLARANAVTALHIANSLSKVGKGEKTTEEWINDILGHINIGDQNMADVGDIIKSSIGKKVFAQKIWEEDGRFVTLNGEPVPVSFIWSDPARIVASITAEGKSMLEVDKEIDEMISKYQGYLDMDPQWIQNSKDKLTEEEQKEVEDFAKKNYRNRWIDYFDWDNDFNLRGFSKDQNDYLQAIWYTKEYKGNVKALKKAKKLNQQGGFTYRNDMETYGKTIDEINKALESNDKRVIAQALASSEGRIEFNVTTARDPDVQATLREVMDKNGFKKDQIDDVMNFIEDIAKQTMEIAEGHRNLLDWNLKEVELYEKTIRGKKHLRPKISSIISNGDYDFNNELSTLCVKREALDILITRLIQYDNKHKTNYTSNLGSVQLLAIRELLKARGYLVACIFCFVEGKRLHQLKFANNMAYEWDTIRMAIGIAEDEELGNLDIGDGKIVLTKEQKKILKELSGGGYSLKRKKGQEIAQNAYDKYIPEHRKRHYEGSKESDAGITLNKTATLAKIMLERDTLAGRFRPEYMLSSAGVDMIKTKFFDTGLATYIGGWFGTASPKPIQGNIVYDPRGMLEKPSTGQKRENFVKKLYRIGGSRFQSFSDLNPIQAFDVFQLFMDHAIRKFPMHTYTKVPALIEMFGLNGCMFNMSVLMKSDGISPAGLTLNEKGEYEYAISDETFGTLSEFKSTQEYLEYVMDFRKKYRNTTAIAVGLSDEHIWKMFEDVLFDQIIPIHFSGMTRLQIDGAGLKGATDYSNFQNTKKFDFFKGQKDIFKKPEAANDIASNKEYIDSAKEKKLNFDFNEAIQRLNKENPNYGAKEAAKEYLEWCRDNHLCPKFPQFVYKPDGSYNENYYKVLADFVSYDLDGKPVIQGAISYKPNMEGFQASLKKAMDEREPVLKSYENINEGTDIFNEILNILRPQKLDGAFKDALEERLSSALGKEKVVTLNAADFHERMENDLKKSMGEEAAKKKMEVFRKTSGVVYGYAQNGTIVLNGSEYNANTPAHEFTHIWAKVAQHVNPALWKEGVALLKKENEFWEGIRQDPRYYDIKDDDDAVASEMLARLVGAENETLIRSASDISSLDSAGMAKIAKEAFKRIKEWFEKLWGEVRSIFDKSDKPLTLDEFKHMPLKDLWDIQSNANFQAALKEMEESKQMSFMAGSDVFPSYVGINANLETEAQKALTEAYQLKTSGVSIEEIRQKTGWFIDPKDGKWKYEISDKDAVINIEVLKAMFSNKKKDATIKDIIKHDKLFAAYPDLGDIEVNYNYHLRNTLGQIYPINGKYVMDLKKTVDYKDLKSTILHEIQHLVQKKEGFARGGMPKGKQPALRNDLVPFYRERHSLHLKLWEKLKEAGYKVEREYSVSHLFIRDARKILNKLAKDDADLKAKLEKLDELDAKLKRFDESDPYLKYLDLGGENESRDVQARMDMTDEERRATQPANLAGEKAPVYIFSIDGKKIETPLPTPTPQVSSPTLAGYFDPKTLEIRLTSATNPTTFSHELFHYFMFNMVKMYNDGTMAADWVKSFEKAMKWAGAEKIDGKYDFSVGNVNTMLAQEKLAEGFTSYLLRGKAPSKQTRSLFGIMKDWFMFAYSTLRMKQVKLSGEVTGFYDKIFSINGDIETRIELEKIGTIKRPAGISDEDWQKYVDLKEESKGAALGKAIEAMAKEAKLRTEEAYKERYKQMYETKLAELNSLPEFKALERAKTEKISRTSVNDVIGKGQKPYSKFLDENGVHISILAQESGLSSVAEFVKFINSTKKPEDLAKAYAEEQANLWMEKQHPELQDIEAKNAVRTIATIKTLVMEFMMLKGIPLSQFNTYFNEMKKSVETVVAQTSLNEIANPEKWYKRLTNLLDRINVAQSQGNMNKLAQLKWRAAFMNYTIMISKDLENSKKKFKKRYAKFRYSPTVRQLESIDGVMWNIIKDTLCNWGLAPTRSKDELVSTRVQRYVNETLEFDYAGGEELINRSFILDNINGTSFGKITTGDFINLEYTLDELWNLSSEVRTVEVDGQKMSIQHLANKIVKHQKKVGYKPWNEKDKSWLKDFYVGFLGIAETQLSKIFPNEVFGNLVLKFQDGLAHAERWRIDTSKRFFDILAPIMKYQNREIVIDGMSWTVSELLNMMLNFGNEHNFRCLAHTIAKERGLEDEFRDDIVLSVIEQAQQAIEEAGITGFDIRDAAQQIWDIFEEHLPAIQEAQYKLTSREVVPVKARPYKFPDGKELRGGYYPARKKINEGKNKDTHDANWIQKEFSVALERDNKPHEIPMDLTSLNNWLSQLGKLLFVALPANNLSRVLRNEDVVRTIGDAAVRFANDWLQSSMIPEKMSPLFSRLTLLSSTYILGGKIASIPVQMLGIISAIHDLGYVEPMKSIARFFTVKGAFQMWKRIEEKSVYMKNRYSDPLNYIAGLQTLDNMLLSKGDEAQKVIAKYMMKFVEKGDQFASIMVWDAAYNKALSEGKSDSDAVLFADSAVRTTQSDTSAGARAKAMRGMGRYLSPFSSFYIASNNLISSKVTWGGKKGVTDAALTLLLVGVLSPVLETIVKAPIVYLGLTDEERRKRKIKDLASFIKDQLKYNQAEAALNVLIPSFGFASDFVFYADRGYFRDSNILPLTTIKKIGTIPVDIAKALASEKQKDKEKGFKRTLDAFGLGLGGININNLERSLRVILKPLGFDF